MNFLAPYGQSIALGAALVAAFGVYLSNRHAENEEIRHRDKLVARDAQLLERADENKRLQAELRVVAEETIRQLTGEGGYAIVVTFFTSISPEIVKREGHVIPDVIPTRFGILNNASDAPVIEPLVVITQRVPSGEGFDGSDGNIVFRERIGNVYPSVGPTMLNAQSTITKSRDNWFDVLIISRAGKWSQSIVVTWNGELWDRDYRLLQLKDADRNIEEKTLHTIRDDFPFQDERRP